MKCVQVWAKGTSLFLSVVMSATTAFSATPAQTPPSRYDGETIFRGVLLDDGPVAKLFPEFWSKASLATYEKMAAERGSQERAAAAKQKIITFLRAQDPTFFDRFGVEMQSGDPVRIQQAVTEAGTRMKKEIQTEFSSASGDVIPVDIDTDVEYYYYYYYYYYAAAAAAIVIAIAAALVEVLDADSNASDSHSALQRDVYVAQIAQRLGPAAAH